MSKVDEVYESQIGRMVVDAERHLTNKDENYPPFDVHERRLRILAYAIEKSAHMTDGTCVTLYGIQKALREIVEGETPNV